jgi:hypothetical protein
MYTRYMHGMQAAHPESDPAAMHATMLFLLQEQPDGAHKANPANWGRTGPKLWAKGRCACHIHRPHPHASDYRFCTINETM